MPYDKSPIAVRGGARTNPGPRLQPAHAAPGLPHAATAGVLAPALPRIYAPRRRLWERLDEAVKGSVTLVVAPAGAGKTLGVAGWVRTASDRAESTVWIAADSSWTPDRFDALLDTLLDGAPAP